MNQASSSKGTDKDSAQHSRLPEILAVSNRILVMREGRVSATLDRAEATEERIMLHATRRDA